MTTLNRAKRKFLMAYIVAAVLLVPLHAGIFFAKADSIWPCQKWADEKYRSSLGMGILIGIGYSIFWPAGTPTAFLLSGFAEHGVRLSPMTREERYIRKECRYESAR